MQNLTRIDNKNSTTESISPKGIHHTVSYAVSFNDTWNHIRNEIRKSYHQAQLQ